jgi:hypothetical protein
MSESSTGGKAGFTRRRFIIGTVGVSAAAALGGTVVRAPRTMAGGAPSGPPTTTLPLPTTTQPVEDAPWSAAINPTDAYGYSIFDVDPGARPGETTITFQYFAIPAVTDEAGSAHDGTTTLPTTPTEKFVFGRQVGRP